MLKLNLKGKGLLIWAVTLLLLSAIALKSGEIMFLAPFILLAPGLLVLGLALGATFFARFYIKRYESSWIFFLIVLIFFGLNTRIPTLVSDLFTVKWSEENFTRKQTVALSQPIKIIYSGDAFGARRFPYDSARPRCDGENCFVAKGFRTPLPHIDDDYWSESPVSVALDAGFTIAHANEHAPTLEIETKTKEFLLFVNLRLTNADGDAISTAKYVYRNGFPFEPIDDSESVGYYKMFSPELKRNFLWHGNYVNYLTSNLVASVRSYPIKHFLSKNFEFRDQLNQPEKIQEVKLEVVEEENFDPELVFKGIDRESAKDPWPEKGWDEKRYKYCDTLLKKESPEAKGGLSQVWWKFVNDPSGRIKIRRSSLQLCDENTIWLFDYGLKHPDMIIAKYKINGELQYQIFFQRPAKIDGYDGEIRQKTFHEKDGHVYFEWMEAHRSGFDLAIKKNMLVRFLEPRK